MKRRIINFVVIFLVIILFGSFYFINENNYKNIKEFKYSLITHPEFLPKKEFVEYSTFGFSSLKADIYWLETIQYIGSNVIGSDYKKYLYVMVDLITELSPYFEKPYLIGQLLLPSYNERYEYLDEGKQLTYTKQGEEIGLKGIKNFCDENKIELIKSQTDLEKIWSEEKYKNPCKKQDLPFGQAFLYYFYLKNPGASANYYKIASANEDSLKGAKIMSAIMSGKSGDREISIMMFLTLAKSLNKDNVDICTVFGNELEQVAFGIYRNGDELSAEIIEAIEKLRKEKFEFSKEKEKNILLTNNCNNYILKAIRELNLEYLERANEKYFQDNKKNVMDAKVLLDEGYIDFLPTDFQQYENYGIIYFYNEEIGQFDYKMGSY